eukprot:m.133423 g.133423  ORF g.133423 m.133423 type:complete len:430 (-) comp16511_c0_seq2:523-1812(-)
MKGRYTKHKYKSTQREKPHPCTILTQQPWFPLSLALGSRLLGLLLAEVDQAGLRLDLLIGLREGVGGAEAGAAGLEEGVVEHRAELVPRAEDVRVAGLPAAHLPRPVLHGARSPLRVELPAFLDHLWRAVGADVDPEAPVLALLEAVLARVQEARLVAAVVDAHREDEERVDVEPLVEVLQADAELAQRHDGLLHDVCVDRGLADDGALEELEQRNLGSAEPAPERAVDRVVGEGDHVLQLPEDRAGEAVVVVRQRHNLLLLALGQEGLHPLVVEGLEPVVDRVVDGLLCRRLGRIAVLGDLDDGGVAAVAGGLEEGGRVCLQGKLQHLVLQVLGRVGWHIADAHIGLDADKAHRQAGQEAQAAVAPGDGPEQIGVRLLIDLLDLAGGQHHLVLEHCLLEEAAAVAVGLQAKAERHTANGNALHLHLDF